MLECTALTKRYEGKKRAAVDSLSLTIGGGEIFGFLGPNGAGKSTTIRMIVGLLAPDSGSISFRGVASAQSVAYKKMIGYCADEPTFYEKMTGREHLSFLADLYEIDEIRRAERIGSLSTRMLLTRELEDPISSYSHGMRQKLSVIAALLHEPKLLVLDEPMVGLDPKASFTLKTLLKEYAAAGNTVFFSTHVLEVAEQLCTTLGIINEGALLYSGSFADLRSQNGAGQQSLESLFLSLTEEQP